MNTLMGQPTTEELLPLIRRAAEAGAEVLLHRRGMVRRPGDRRLVVRPSGSGARRPPGSPAACGASSTRIRDARHGAGIWLEPEVVGVDSPAAARLPEEAFFQRFGQRVQEDRRYHLDFRHPAARAHLDATVDHLVEEFGIRYLKLDYNINPVRAPSATRRRRATGCSLTPARSATGWCGVQQRHPSLLIENCSSGAMRADYALLAVTHLQSTSDQQDFRLYPPIAASAPASILPEQCGNWAYPRPT